MFIQKVSITNFRGISGNREFLFDIKPFVLLSASNGLGKTTIIDAIEWALTGNIGRLKHSYVERSSNNLERRVNKKGILINKYAGSTEKVIVELMIVDRDKREHCIKREQKRDELDESSSSVWYDGSEDLAKTEIFKIVGGSFYNYHFCDIQKSFNIQNSKREKLPELFTEFISDYSQESTIAENLDLFIDDIDRYKDDLEKSKISQSTIDLLKKDLEKYSESPIIIEYPKTILYENENLLLKEQNESLLKNQLSQIYLCGYKKVEEILNDILENGNKLEIIKHLNILRNYVEEKKELIDNAFLVGFYKGRQVIIELNEKISKYSDIKLKKENLEKYASLIIAIKDTRFSEECYEKVTIKIRDLKEKDKGLEKEIDKLTNGNEIIDALSSLVSKSVGIKKYRLKELKENGNVNCPVCGSDIFGKLEDTEILKEANIFVEENGEEIAYKKTLRDDNEKDIDEYYNNILLIANSVLNDFNEKLNYKKTELEKLEIESKSFFDIAKILEKIDENSYELKKMCSLEYLDSCIINMKNNCLDKSALEEKRSKYNNILTLLDFKMDEKTSEKAIALHVKERAKASPKIICFSLELFTKKINSLNSILGSQVYQIKNKELVESIEKNKNIEEQKTKLDVTKKKAEIKVKKIHHLVEELKANEYKNIGPMLNKFYKKLSRINSIEDIKVILDNNQLSLVDEKGNNIVNVLSNGQLSIFMLAYFFAGVYCRSENEKCKIYFIDDLTACLDDVNMLAFLDLMKYQMLSKDRAIDQLFFVSCDTDICKLLKYKLEGAEIDYIELTEKNFS